MNFVKSPKIARDDSTDDFEFVDANEELDMSNLPEDEADEKLASNIGKILSALCDIIENQGIVVTVPLKSMAATTVGAITGSLLGGPSGLAIGLITGAVISYRCSPRRSKSPTPETKRASLRDIFKQMTAEQKKELINVLVSCLKQSNIRRLLTEILKNEKIRNMAIEILSGFLMKKMGFSLLRPT